jgi:general secretion pathway protein B
MSYILEALKKAQAERQLGNAPDIHTPAPVAVPAASATANRKPLLIGLGAGVLVAGIAAGLVLRAKTPAGAPAVPAQAGMAAGQAAASRAAAETVAAAAGPVEAAPVARPVAPPAAPPEVPQKSAPVPQPAGRVNAAAATPAAPRLAAAPAAPPRSAAPASTNPPPAPAAAREPVPEAVYLPAPAPEPVPAAPVRAPDPIVEENLRTLQQLPEAIQREVPRVSVGGYIYSPNPADRLLLVDKMLRREGEELAPGLVLERLRPKYAVMNYRGTRYRVAY